MEKGCAVLQLATNVEGKDVQKKQDVQEGKDVLINAAHKELPKKEKYVVRVRKSPHVY